MRLDIVFPAHNEAHRIGRTLHEYRHACPDPEIRFLVALDDCTDGTEHVVAAQARFDPRVEVLRFPRLGKGGVLLEAFRRTAADLVAFVDADGSTPPKELLRLAEVTRSHDAAIASRWHPAAVLPARRALSRRVASLTFAVLVRTLFDLPYRDTQCGAKVLRREVAERVIPLVASRDFLFDVDLLLVLRALGFRVAEVPTIWVDREGSRLSAGRDSRRMAVSVLRLWLHHRVIPVRLPAAPPYPAAAAAVTAGATAAPPRPPRPSVVDLREVQDVQA